MQSKLKKITTSKKKNYIFSFWVEQLLNLLYNWLARGRNLRHPCEFSNEIQEFECPGQDEFTHCAFSPIWSLDSKPILPGMMFQH